MSKNRWRQHRPLFSQPITQSKKQTKTRWRILPILWGALKRMCMVIGAFFLFSIFMGVIASLNVQKTQTVELPKEMVLYLEFDRMLTEKPLEPSFTDPFAFNAPTVHDYINALDHAAKDPRVKGVLARFQPGAAFSMVHIEELRDAVKRFRASGKFTHVYSSSYAETGGFGAYYMATAFENMWMQPMGVVAVQGLSAEVPFFRDTLDKVGIEPHFFQRKEYKTAYESVTNAQMSNANRESLQGVIDTYKDQMVAGIAADRNMTPENVLRLVDKGIFTAEDAAKYNLVTTVDYVDVLVRNIKKEITGDPEFDNSIFVTFNGYITDMKRKVKGKNKQYILPGQKKENVALIYAVGAIVPSGMNTKAPTISNIFIGGDIAAADEIAPAILAASERNDIKAIVIRVDSPGGSPTASESILRAIRRAKDKGKPVYISMGNAAASGGYWIAAYADKIFASPTTITGSIGVLGGKVSSRELMDNIGVNWERVEWGRNANINSFVSPYSESEKRQIDGMLDSIYDAFTARVSEGRNIPMDTVQEIAKGRVWTGAQAYKIGLVDELGGLTDTLDYVSKTLGLENRSELSVNIFPKEPTPLEQFIKLLGGDTAIFAQYFGIKAAIPTEIKPTLNTISIMESNRYGMVFEPFVLHHY